VKFICKTHKVELEIQGKKRRYTGEGVSWAGTPMCKLFIMKEPREGKVGECVIERIG